MSKKNPKLAIPFRCQCGRKFLTLASATRATLKGCKCGGFDIDEDTGPASELKKAVEVGTVYVNGCNLGAGERDAAGNIEMGPHVTERNRS